MAVVTFSKSNGVSYITRTESKLGDLLSEKFPPEKAHAIKVWADGLGLEMFSFWDYTATKKAIPGIHLAPIPAYAPTEERFIAFGEEFAFKILAIEYLPDR